MKKSYEIYYNRNEILIYNVQSNTGSLLTWRLKSRCSEVLDVKKNFPRRLEKVWL